jgi:hypothetical protein
VSVRALRTLRSQGEEQIHPVASGITDALGEFRLIDLPAGRYYVTAAPPRVGTAPDAAAAPFGLAFLAGGASAPTYYPGTSDPDQADTVRVAHGQETGGLYLRILPARVASVSGIVVESLSGPGADYVVMLDPASVRTGGSTLFSEPDRDGRFSFAGVPPGPYRIVVRNKHYFEAIATAGGTIGQPQDDDLEFASEPIRVYEQDVVDLVVRTGPGFRLSGRVTIEGASPEELAAVLRSLEVRAFEVGGPPMSRGMWTAETDVRDDGTFELRHLIGLRMVRLEAPRGWTLKQVRAFTRDITDDGIEILNDVFDVEMTIARETRVIGTVSDRRGDAVPGAVVVVFPVNREQWTLPHNRYIRVVRAGTEGTFDITGLPAARYYAVALPAPDDGAMNDFEDFEDLEGRAPVTFTLSDGQQFPLQLRVP